MVGIWDGLGAWHGIPLTTRRKLDGVRSSLAFTCPLRTTYTALSVCFTWCRGRRDPISGYSVWLREGAMHCEAAIARRMERRRERERGREGETSHFRGGKQNHYATTASSVPSILRPSEIVISLIGRGVQNSHTKLDSILT